MYVCILPIHRLYMYMHAYVCIFFNYSKLYNFIKYKFKTIIITIIIKILNTINNINNLIDKQYIVIVPQEIVDGGQEIDLISIEKTMKRLCFYAEFLCHQNYLI